jgi:hypothetical protein
MVIGCDGKQYRAILGRRMITKMQHAHSVMPTFVRSVITGNFMVPLNGTVFFLLLSTYSPINRQPQEDDEQTAQGVKRAMYHQ